MFLGFGGLRGESVVEEEALEAGCCCKRPSRKTFQEEPAMELMIAKVARIGHRDGQSVHRGTIKNSGLVMMACRIVWSAASRSVGDEDDG